MTTKRGRFYVRWLAVCQAIALPTVYDQRCAFLLLGIQTLLLHASPQQDQATLLDREGNSLRRFAIDARVPRRFPRTGERRESNAVLVALVAIGERACLAHHAPGTTRCPGTDGHSAAWIERRDSEGRRSLRG